MVDDHALGSTEMFTTIRSILRDESGATMIEYGLIAALVSIAAVAALTTVGSSLRTMFTTVSGYMQDAITP